MTDPRLLRALFWAALCGVLGYALVPVESLPHANLWDKLQHAGAFAFLALLGLRTYGFAQLRRVMLGLAAFGGLIEILQSLPVIHRDAELLDWVADGAGIASGVLAAWLLRRARA